MDLKSPVTAIKTQNKFFYLKSLLTVLFLSFLLTGCNIADNFSMSNDSSVDIVQNNNSFLELDFSINNYTITKIEEDGKIYSDVTFDNGVRLDKKGLAALPFLHASVQLPGSGEVEYEIINEEHIDMPLLHPFLPSRGTIYRNQNPSNIKRSIDPASFAHKNYPDEIIKLSEPYIFRDVRGINVYAHSFSYDANNQILRIYTKLKVSINHYNTIEARNSMTSPPESIVNEMRPIYKSLFINYGSLNSNSDIQRSFSNDITEFGELLVLYTSRDTSAIIPYLDWKRHVGYKVHAKQVPTGINVKTIIQNEYNSNSRKNIYCKNYFKWIRRPGCKGNSVPGRHDIHSINK